jgi:hypothetical protein
VIRSAVFLIRLSWEYSAKFNAGLLDVFN